MEVVRVCSQICENPIRDDNKPCGIHPPSPCGFYAIPNHGRFMARVYLNDNAIPVHAVHSITMPSVKCGVRPEGYWGERYDNQETQMGVSENSVPLNPMVNDHYPY